MADLKVTYGATAQAFTCSVASLANNSARESNAVSNISDRFLDALVGLRIMVTSDTGVSSLGYVNVYAYGTVSSGGRYTDGATGADAAFTFTSSPSFNARLIGVINAASRGQLYNGGPWSVAAAFGGIVPEKWGIIVENKTGAALAGSEAAFVKEYQGIYASTA